MKSFCLFCISGHRFDYYGAWLKTLIAQAYRIDARLIQGPEWLGRNDLGRWVIHAEMPEGATKEQIPEMLQSLLRERFHLMAPYGTAEHPAYTLVAGKNGVKLKPPREMDKSAGSP